MANQATYKFTFDHGWPMLQEAINQLIDILEGVRSHKFSSEEYILAYTTAYNICDVSATSPEPAKLYGQYKKTFEDYISSKVLPSLREKKDEDLLLGLVKRWNNHKVLTRWISGFCKSLDRYYILRKALPSLNTTSLLIFCELVHGEMNDQVTGTLTSMIDRDRQGEQIDRTLVKSVLDVYVEIGEGLMKHDRVVSMEIGERPMKYYEDLEQAMLEGTKSFYAQKASIWILSESHTDYKLKVEESLKQERDRVACYLQSTSQQKLLLAVELELLSAYGSKLEEKIQLKGVELEALSARASELKEEKQLDG